MPSPYSDSLYASHELDGENLDALSPTNGYFHASSPTQDAAAAGAAAGATVPPSSSSRAVDDQLHHISANVPRIPDVLVEDPTLASPASSKVGAGEPGRWSLNSDPASPEPTGRAAWSPSFQDSSQRRRVDEQGHHRRYQDQPGISVGQHPPNFSSPLFSHPVVDAPPAYTPPSASRPTGYQTFGPSPSTMGLPEQRQRLIANPPESMSLPLHDGSSSGWQRAKDSIGDSVWRKRIKTILAVLLALSIFLLLLSSMTAYAGQPRKGINDPDPVRDPAMDHGDLKWHPLNGCLNSPHVFPKKTMTVETTSSRSLTLKQTQEKHPGSSRYPQIWGQVILRPHDSSGAGSIDVEVISNDKDLGVKIEYDSNAQSLHMITPRVIEWSKQDAPCIQIRATVWLPHDAFLKTLKIETLQLDVEILEGLVAGTAQDTSVRTASGDIKAPAPDNDDALPYTLSSREIYIATISGDIRGWYPLYDLLEIRTASGDITADVGPKPALKDHVRPAVLNVHSVSGTVNLREPIHQGASTVSAGEARSLEERDYHVDVSTTSADVTAELATGSRATFASQSGALRLTLQPLLVVGGGGGTAAPGLHTDSKSGDTRLTLLEPAWASPPADQPALGVLASRHVSVSGDIRLAYPTSWEGSLRATTVSGSQDVRGEGLEVIRSGGPGRKSLTGRKGHGNSRLEVDSVSGDQRVMVGWE